MKRSYGELLKVLLILTLIIPVVVATRADMYIFAVSEDGTGVPARLIIDISSGSGTIHLTLNTIVGTDTQKSIEGAIKAAVREAGEDFFKYDYYVTIESNAEYVEGPSAGLPIAIATFYALKGKDVPDTISATGTIDKYGNVGPVGGIYEKVKAAHEVGVKLFFIPKGERYVEAPTEKEVEPGITVPSRGTVDIVALAKKEWNMEVYEVGTLKEALDIAFRGEKPEVNIENSSEASVPETNFIPVAVPTKYSASFKPIVEDLLNLLDSELNNFSCKDKKFSSAREVAEKYYKRALEVIKRGYYYTAGNYAFLALVSLSSADEMCTHPSLSNPNSLAMKILLEEVEENLERVKSRAQKFQLTTENFEFVGGARERIIRAESALSSPVITTDPAYSLKLIFSAKYWIYTADKMLDMAEELNRGAPLNGIEKLAEEEIIYVEDLIAKSGKNDPEAEKRIMWAKEAFNRGWYVAAYTEAALADGTFIGDNIREDKIKDYISNLMKETEEYEGMWTELYRNHGLYYKQAGEVYEDNSRKEEAINMYRTAVQMLEASKELDRFYKALTPIKGAVVISKKAELNKDIILAVSAALLAFALVLLALYYLQERKRKKIISKIPPEKRKDVDALVREIRALKKLERELERIYSKDKTEEIRKELDKVRRKLKRLESKLSKILEPSPQPRSSRSGRGKRR